MSLSVTEAREVARKLRAESTSHAGGPDDLPNCVLKKYADILASPIADILNTSFLERRVPCVWKLADIPLLPKVSMTCDFIKDLRSISLTPHRKRIETNNIVIY